MEQICCVVTVSEPGPNPHAVSCSGVVLNESGIVICSGTVFARFLIDKELMSKTSNVLHSSNFSKEMQVSVHYVDVEGVRTKQNLPLIHQNASLLFLINCTEFQEAFDKMFTEAEKWDFSSGDEDVLFDSRFLSWFGVLKMTEMATLTPTSAKSSAPAWVKSTVLQKGQSVLACGSPFGSFCPDLFMSTLSKGIVSNLAGEENAMILTDARCLPGTEGGGLFVRDGDDGDGGEDGDRKSPCLVGLVASPLCWKSNEWIGLTLVCSFHLILKNIHQVMSLHHSHRDIFITDSHQVGIAATPKTGWRKFPKVVLVESGQLWGSGILINPSLVLTCRHVVNGKQFLTVRVNTNKRFHTVRGQVLFSSKVASPYDVALLQLHEPVSDAVSLQFGTSFQPGEDVVVLGYGVFGKNCGPSVTSGILSRVIIRQNKPVMLQTTCAVQSGASGGAVLRAGTGELLGVVSSNTRDFTTKVTYPHLNFSIPVSVLEPLLSRFGQTGDAAVFQVLDSADDEVRRVWRLQIPQSKL